MARSILCSVLLLLVTSRLLAIGAVDGRAVAEAAITLTKQPRDAGAWQVMQGVAQGEGQEAALRSRVLYLYALSHLVQKNTNNFNATIGKLAKEYPLEAAGLTNRLAQSEWLVECATCAGQGKRLVTVGDGRQQERECHICRGSGRVVELRAGVGEVYRALLNDIRATATVSVEFAAAAKKALVEGGLERREQELKQVLERYAGRPDLEPLKRALEETEEELRTVAAAAAKREEEREQRRKEEQDYDTICKALEHLPFGGIEVVLAEIDSFEERYPTSQYLVELRVERAAQARRLILYRNFWRGIYVCAGVMVIFLAAAFVRDILTRKKPTQTRLNLPGLDDKDAVSDPLAGSFDDDEE